MPSKEELERDVTEIWEREKEANRPRNAAIPEQARKEAERMAASFRVDLEARRKEREAQAEAFGAATARVLRDEFGFKSLPIENETERRAICLKLAIETKGVAFSLKNDASVADAAQQVVAAAKIFEAYVAGADVV